MGFFEGVKGGEIVGASDRRCEMGVHTSVWAPDIYMGGLEKGELTHF